MTLKISCLLAAGILAGGRRTHTLMKTSIPWILAIVVFRLVFLVNRVQGQLLVENGNAIGAFNFNGTTINSNLISGLSGPQGIAISGNQVFVANYVAGTIGKYNLDGSVVNGSLISGLIGPEGIAINGTNLYVATWGNGTGNGAVGKYTVNGAVVNAALISGLYSANGLAIAGTNIFVANQNSRIGKYALTGAAVNASFITGLSSPGGIAISGTNLYIPNIGTGRIIEYTTAGTLVTTSLVAHLSGPNGIAISGNNLYVVNYGSETVGAYALDGTPINTSLISGLSNNPASNFGILALPPPTVQTDGGSIGVRTNIFGFSVAGISNQNIVIEACTNLMAGVWTPLQTNTLGVGTNFIGDTSWTNYSSRAYRVRPQ